MAEKTKRKIVVLALTLDDAHKLEQLLKNAEDLYGPAMVKDEEGKKRLARLDKIRTRINKQLNKLK